MNNPGAPVGFSLIDKSFERLELELSLQALYAPASAWDAKDSTKNKVASRRAHIKNDYWAFDQIYFPPESYAGAYAPANAFHRNIVAAAERSGRTCTLIIGPHDHAKSAMLYKKIAHAGLTGERHFVGLVSQTLETPKEIIRAQSHWLHNNPRIRHDFPDLEFLIDNEETLQIRTKDNPIGCIYKAFSESRSTRGKNVSMFFRFDMIIVEDLENRKSSMEEDAVQDRKDVLAEFQSSLSEHGCLVMTANNFDERCVSNSMILDSEAGALDASWDVQSYAAWTASGPLWPERFPAKSEEELRAMLKPMNDATWKGSYMSKPQKPAGYYFKNEHQLDYDAPPRDSIGIIYADPNLAKKGKGNRTCMGALLYSFTTQLFYPFNIRYKSFSDSNVFFDTMRDCVQMMKARNLQLVSMCMDGNVTQESNWTQHLENYCRINHVIIPPIDYKSYNVEMYAKNAQTFWDQKRVRMPAQFHDGDERRDFFNDFYAFTGRKLPGGKDDGPDWFVCAVQAMMELGYGAYIGTPPPLKEPFKRSGLTAPKAQRM